MRNTDTTCSGCDKQFREEDVAAFQRSADGSLEWVCRKCLRKWHEQGFLWPSLPFWKRKEEEKALQAHIKDRLDGD